MDGPLVNGRVLAIVGNAGSGKSWLGERLAPALGIARLVVDDFGAPGSDRWSGLLQAIADTPGLVLVESCAAPADYRKLAGLAIHVWVGPKVRMRRLVKRGESRADARRMVRQTNLIPRRADINVRGDMTEGEVTELAERLARMGWQEGVR